MLNMPPFFAEMERVLRPGGQVIVASSWGPATPVLHPALAPALEVPPARDRAGRDRRGRRRDVLCRPPSRAAEPGAARIGSVAMESSGMPLVLLVNPSAGRRQDAEAAAADRGRARRAPGRVPGPADQGPRARRRRGAAGGRSGRAAGGRQRRRPDRRRRRRDGRGRDPARDHPRRARQRPRPRPRDPRRPGGGGRGPRRRPLAADRRRRGQRQALPRHRQRRLRLRSEPARQRNASSFRGSLVYAYAALRTLVGWKPARFTVRVDDERTRFTGYSVSVANSRAFGGGMFVAPDAELDDGLFDVSWSARAASSASWVTCRRCSREPTSSSTRSPCSGRRTWS